MRETSTKKQNLQKARQAWLITWKWSGDQAQVENRVVAILNWRLSQLSVEAFVEQAWASQRLSWFEQVAVAKNKKKLAYRAEPRQLFEGQVTCGHNPWLEAKRVYDLEAFIDESGREHLIWKYWKPAMKEDKVESTYIPCHLVREVDGTEHYLN